MERVLRALAVAVSLLALAGCGGGGEAAPPADTQRPAETAPSPGAEPVPAPPQAPAVAMSWDSAGAFVWHETDVSPEALGQELRDAGFGWVALFLHDGLSEDPVEADWANRFRHASGLAVGGWGALRDRPAEEAALADRLLARYGLDFYVANPEAEYMYTGPDGPSPERFARSRAFVDAFRRLRPELPAAVSSYCRADRHDLDWAAWREAGFAFLPQAYVNDFGSQATPAACAAGARGFFPADAVHPTVGMYPGVERSLRAAGYARLLASAGTVGFSVYLAETRMTPQEWRALGEAIRTRGIARTPAPS